MPRLKQKSAAGGIPIRAGGLRRIVREPAPRPLLRCARLLALPLRPSPPQRRLVAAPTSIGPADIHQAIQQLATAIARRHAGVPPILLGVANGGIVLARRLAALIPGAPSGVIDISFHRDDLGRHPIPKEFAPTQIPVDVTGAAVVLVDDVLFSGRTAKAALDELFDHGRPARVELAVLVDRGGRRLPIAADYRGLTLEPADTERVVVVLNPDDPARDAISLQTV